MESGGDMGKFVLNCCSTADMTKEHFDERQIPYACFHYQIGDKVYEDDLGVTVSFADFYKSIEDGAQPVTSQVNSEQYVELFEPFLKEGKDILHLALSSGISGTVNSALIAAKELREKYPDRTIEVVDSLSASSGFGLLVDYVADLRDAGATLAEAKQWVEENKLKVQHWFFSTDLTSFKRGGRISASAAAIATVLGICPLMNVDFRGKLIPREKIRTKKRAIKRIVEVMKEHAEGGTEYDGRCYISNSACRQDAEAVRDLIEENFPHLKGKVLINSIGTVIGSHTGPGTVALFYMGDKRPEEKVEE